MEGLQLGRDYCEVNRVGVRYAGAAGYASYWAWRSSDLARFCGRLVIGRLAIWSAASAS